MLCRTLSCDVGASSRLTVVFLVLEHSIVRVGVESCDLFLFCDFLDMLVDVEDKFLSMSS